METNKKVQYGAVMALKEHILEGNPITQIEAIDLFGVQDLPREITRIRQNGWIVKTQKITMAAAVRRINEYAIFKPPQNLPIKEIFITEYWVNK